MIEQRVGIVSKRIRLTALLLLFVSPCLFSQSVNRTNRDIFSPVQAKNGIVVTSEPIATKIGVEVLKNGGNAVDAAVAVGFAMAVTLPRAGNIGGGGFMLIYLAKTEQILAIDYREKAPTRAHRDMFLNEDGSVDSDLSQYSHLSSGVPGTVAGLALALEKHGTLSLPEALAPAIRLAEEGFEVTPEFSDDIKKKAKYLKKWTSSREIFFKPDGSFYQPGDTFIQEDLSKTLKSIAQKGIQAFYEGEIADLIVREMEAHGGYMTKKDLAGYRPVIRKPVHGTYRSYDVYSVPPPSSGGVHLIQMLNILEGYKIGVRGHNSAATIHRMAEAMKRAYADRSKYLGDPDFVEIPTEGLISKEYAALLRAQIDTGKATLIQDIFPGIPPGYESNETTHYSIVDNQGNAVSNSYTINLSFGSGIVVSGAGFLLNNEMDDFSAKPGVPNAYGLIGGSSNAIQPNKRMLSSTTPTIVLKDGNPFIVTGSPGGSRIITTTLQVIVNVIDHKINIQEAVNAPRFHHQWLPDELRLEEGFSSDTISLLKEMGHKTSVKSTMGAANSILIDHENEFLYGAADPRRNGSAAGY